MNFCKINYKGIFYSNYDYNLFADLFKAPIVVINEIPSTIANICKVEETSTCLTLHLGKIIFDLNEDKPIFNEVFYKTIKFNKDTFKAVGPKIEIEDFSMGNPDFYKEFSVFLEKLFNLNDNIKNHLNKIPKYLKIKNDGGLIFNTTMKNFYNLVIFNYLEYEKIINSDSCSILEANLSSKDFSIEEASKLSQSLGIPKFALPIIKDLELENCLVEIKDISKKIDGNSLRILFTFIDKFSLIFKKNIPVKERDGVMKKFLVDVSFCLNSGYKITDLLNYLIRQNIYYTTKPPFNFPNNEAMFLADYIKMSKKYGLKTEKYPSQLKRQHDIMSKNTLSLEVSTPELEKRFVEAVDDYKDVEKEIVIKEIDSLGNEIFKEYLFLIPKSIKDLIEEGTNLHHCVSSYSDRIINKQSRVVFLREKSTPKQSFITIDIDEDYNLVEAKKAFNEEVDSEYKKVIDKWLKVIKK